VDQAVSEPGGRGELASEVLRKDLNLDQRQEAPVVVVRDPPPVLRDQVGVDVQRRLDGLLKKPLRRFPLVQTLTILVQRKPGQRSERRQRLGDAT